MTSSQRELDAEWRNVIRESEPRQAIPSGSGQVVIRNKEGVPDRKLVSN